MKLKRIFIKNFLSYKEEQEIIIDDKAVIVGENGSGKSNLVRIIDFILSNSHTSSINYDNFPYWDISNPALAYLEFSLKNSDQKLLKQFFMLSLCSMNTSADKEAAESIIYYFVNKYQEILSQSFSSFIVGFESDPYDPERLNYFLLLDANENYFLNFDSNYSNHFFVVKKEKDIETILKQKTRGVEINIKDMNSFKGTAYGAKFIIEENKIDEIKLINSLEACFKDIFQKERRVIIADLKFETINRISELHPYISNLKLIVRNMGYKYDNYNFPSSISQIIALLLKKSTMILREDRGLIKDSFGKKHTGVFTNVITLESTKYFLFDLKMSNKPSEFKLFKKIQDKFCELTNGKYCFNISLLNENIETENEPLLFIEPTGEGSYNREKTEYKIKADSENRVFAYRPEIVFEDKTIVNGKSSNTYFRLGTAPGGAYELLMVLCSIHNNKSDTIILDEPGKTLHPNLRKILSKHIKNSQELGKNNTKIASPTFILVTHAPDLIDEEWLKFVIRCYKDTNGHSKIKYFKQFFKNNVREEKYQAYNDYLLNPRIRDIFFSKGIMFVEGKHDIKLMQALKSALERRLIQEKLQLSKDISFKWDLIPIDGVDNSQKAINIARFFGIPFVLLCDFDAFRPNKTRKILTSRIGRVLQNIFEDNLKGTDFEKYYEDYFGEDKRPLDVDTLNELTSYARKYNIFSWELKIEQMIQDTDKKFTKGRWKYLSFKDRLDMIQDLVVNENRQVMDLIDFLVNKGAIDKS